MKKIDKIPKIKVTHIISKGGYNMSYNFFIEKALKEIKYDLSEIKIMIIGTGSVANEINENLKNKCSEIYFVPRKDNKIKDSKNENRKLKDIEIKEPKIIELKNIKEEICKMDIVFITENICNIDKNVLILMSNETVIVDLTKVNENYNNEETKKCVDLESARKLGIKVI